MESNDKVTVNRLVKPLSDQDVRAVYSHVRDEFPDTELTLEAISMMARVSKGLLVETLRQHGLELDQSDSITWEQAKARLGEAVKKAAGDESVH